jgi:sulfur carrier protein ThiS
VTVTLRLRDKEYEVRAGMTVRDAMLQVGIEPESVIPTRQGELITDDEILKDGERIRLVAVISGGSR